jgi:N utilization substance protein A
LIKSKINVAAEDTHSSQPRPELLQVAEAVAIEKNIDKEESLAAMECAIQKAAKTKYGNEQDIRARIDRKTGEIVIEKVLTVVEIVENPLNEISLDDAQKQDPGIVLGGELTELLPPLMFGRAAAHGARQIVIQKIKEAERERQFSEFVERKGEIISGIVKHVDNNRVIVDIGHTEGVLRSEDNIPRQTFNIGDRVKALLVDIRPESLGPMLILSRTHNDFIAKLFEQDVTEIYDGLIKIMAIARDPGSRAKMAVYSPDSRIDPIGACVGVKGSRVNAVMTEINGEKIDIVAWATDPAAYVMNALSLPEFKRVVFDEEEERIDVVVEDEFLSQAIGRRGQNVRLASMLTGWKITVIPETEDANRRMVERATAVKSFIETLEIDDMWAQVLVTEGFFSVESIAETDVHDIISINGFSEEFAQDVHKKATLFVAKQEQIFFDKCERLNIDDDFLALPHLDVSMFSKLIDNNICTISDVADLSTDELFDVIGENVLDRDKAGVVIMTARQKSFDDSSCQS